MIWMAFLHGVYLSNKSYFLKLCRNNLLWYILGKLTLLCQLPGIFCIFCILQLKKTQKFIKIIQKLKKSTSSFYIPHFRLRCQMCTGKKYLRWSNLNIANFIVYFIKIDEKNGFFLFLALKIPWIHKCMHSVFFNGLVYI